MLHKYDPKSVWYVERIFSRRYVIHESPVALYFRKRSEVETREGEWYTAGASFAGSA